MDKSLPKHFESLYPDHCWLEEIEEVVDFLKKGNSVQLISLPGVGKSNILRLLAYNRSLREKHFGENQKYVHFVYMDLSEVEKKNVFDVNKFIFLSIADSLKDRGLLDEHNKIQKLFKDHFSFKDELVLFQGLKEAIDFLAIEKKFSIVLMFDKFEKYSPYTTEDFFQNLKILRNRAKFRFAAIFATIRPLEELLDKQTISPFSDFLTDNHVYVGLFDQPSFEFRLNYLEKMTGKKLEKQIVERLLEVTGGHGKLTRISEEILLSDAKADISKNELVELLLQKSSIGQVISDILKALTPEEIRLLGKGQPTAQIEKLNLFKGTYMSIPLIEKYLKILPKDSSGEKIFKEGDQIKKGETLISDKLTSLEFKFLSFLLDNENKMVQRDEIIKQVWSDTFSTAGVTDQALDQLVSRLRKKIEDDPNNPTYIQTIKGRGIKFLNP